MWSKPKKISKKKLSQLKKNKFASKKKVSKKKIVKKTFCQKKCLGLDNLFGQNIGLQHFSLQFMRKQKFVEKTFG